MDRTELLFPWMTETVQIENLSIPLIFRPNFLNAFRSQAQFAFLAVH